MEPRPPALGAQSLNHCATREVPKVFIFYAQMKMKSCEIGPTLDMLRGDTIVVEIMIFKKIFFLWKISHRYKNRESDVMNSRVSITQLQ